MQVVGRAVERIDNPDVVRFTDNAGLLGEKRVIGIVLEDRIDDGLLGRVVGVADEIVMPLALDF